jgi:hypothetical protein
MKIKEQIPVLAKVLRRYMENEYNEETNSLNIQKAEQNTIEKLDIIMAYLMNDASNCKMDRIQDFYNETINQLELKKHSPVLLITNYIRLTLEELKISIIVSDLPKEINWC